jgi:hypothetical protein
MRLANNTLVEKPEGRDYLEDPDLDEKILLERILGK